MYLTWPSFNNIRLLLMAFMPVVIFYLVWLINTSEAIRSEEGTLLDLVCWPDGNAIPVMIACASLIAVVVQIYGLYQLFKAGLPKREYNVTDGLFYYICALIVMIIIFSAIIFYSALQTAIIRAKIKGGITQAMKQYSSHLPSKVAIDRLQTRFHCCGRVSYQEWFYIPWYNVGGKVNITELARRRFVADNVPYSCCSLVSLCPCVHHGITKKSSIYRYDPDVELTIWKTGCEEKLITEMTTVSWRFNAVMLLIIIAMVLQGVAVRYLHTAYRNGLHIGNQIVSNAYLLRSTSGSEDRGYQASKYNNYRRARTTNWVARAAGSQRYTTSSDASNFDSSDELLKPVFE